MVKHKKQMNRPNQNNTCNSVPKVVVGSRAPKESKITANNVASQKRIYHVSNVTECAASDVVDHLKLIQVDVISASLHSKKSKMMSNLMIRSHPLLSVSVWMPSFQGMYLA